LHFAGNRWLVMPTKKKPLPKRRKPPASQDEQEKKSPAKPKIKIEGLKYFAMLQPLLEHLHEDQCQRDTAGNRTLHYDQYCMLVLLYVLNPTVSSLRSISQASELTKVRDKLGNKKASLGSLSEAGGLFSAELLKPIIETLSAQVTDAAPDPRLSGIKQTITAVDGSLVNALPSLITASILKQTTGSALVRWRLHTHFEVNNLLPSRIDVTPDGGGENDERAVLKRVVEQDRLYVMDRGYAKFALFNSIVSSSSSYVCRLRDNTVYETTRELELTEGDRAAGVISDTIVKLGGSSSNSDCPDHTVRLIQIRCTPHRNRTGGKAKGSTAPNSDGILRIATNLLNVPAEIIALIYSYRWTIEIFFRFYKQLMGGVHLISHNANGIKIQVYCSMIACLLINLWTGSRPTKRTYEMISFYFQGLASEEELLAHIEKRRAAEEAKRAKEERQKIC
jgi:hypothetical protein